MSAMPRSAIFRCCACFFFFQAEASIRDGHVTGVQTCALPICFGRAFRKWWLFMVPEELFFTEVLERLRKSMEQRGRNRRAHDGFLRAVNDPFANAVHIALL